jgi:hypothetical protein
LEKKRRCGWLQNGDASEGPVIWARRRVAVTSCPTSFVTSESIALLEEYHAWKLLGTSEFYTLPARLVEAIFVLENELRSEQNDGEK